MIPFVYYNSETYIFRVVALLIICRCILNKTWPDSHHYQSKPQQAQQPPSHCGLFSMRKVRNEVTEKEKKKINFYI